MLSFEHPPHLHLHLELEQAAAAAVLALVLVQQLRCSQALRAQ